MKKPVLLSFLLKETLVSPKKAIVMAFVSGSSNSLILAMINAGAQHAENSEIRPLYALVFIVGFVLYYISERWLLAEAGGQMEVIIHRVRTRVVKALTGAELRDVERLGRSIIYQNVAQHTQTLSQASSTIALTLQNMVITIFATIYIGYLSLTTLAILATSIVLALFVYFRRFGTIDYEAQVSLKVENDYYTSVSDIIDGFKESKMNSFKTRTLMERSRELSARAADGRIGLSREYAAHFVFSNSVFFLLLGIMVFIAPAFGNEYSSVVQMSTTAVLFIIGPISGVVGSVPLFKSATTAVEEIMALEKKLDSLRKENAGLVIDPDIPENRKSLEKFFDFKIIELKNALFEFDKNPAYPDHPFTVGPISISIKRGETLFITGGNGSGKTTLLRLLTGLYPLASGSIFIDGKKLKRTDQQNFRELFASVFSDFHLSRYLDGVRELDEDLSDHLHELFELPENAVVEDKVFATIDLSTGQRKRLALMTAILEQKKILVLDEWAADQDPVFRRKFYHEILPKLKKEGITIIAITHDSRYFDTSEKQIHLEEGRIVNFDAEKFND